VLVLAVEIGKIGNKNASSDARVGQLLAQTAIQGAVENIKVNVGGMSDRERADQILNSTGQATINPAL
jgi:formiminotetrahydrofolate cyclodeaminase